MELEFHQLRMRYSELRISLPGYEARLMASLAKEGQLHPVLVVADGGDGGASSGYVLIDGYRRAKSLQVMGRDTVEGEVLSLSEPAALLFRHCQEGAHPRTALEDGWLLRELIEVHGLTQAELSRQLQRSESWVSRRLSLVRSLPASAHELVRRGKLCSHGAMKYLVPLARAKRRACKEIVGHLAGRQRTSAREMGEIYECWRRGDGEQRRRVEQHPELFLKAVEALEKAPVKRDPIQNICNDLEILEAVSRRARRGIREAGEPLAAPIVEGWRSAQGTLSVLITTMEARIDAGPGDTGGDPAAQEGGPGDPSHRAGAEDFAEHGTEGAGGGTAGGAGL